MPLTLNQFLLLVLTFAAVIVAVYLVRLFGQLRKTAAAGEKALAEFQALARNLNELDQIVKDKVEVLGKTLDASKKAAANLSEASLLITQKIIYPSSRFLPLAIPVARFVLRHLRKQRKEKSHE
jgi:hypothetical protein